MKCPFCNHLHDKVVDSRESKEGEAFAAAGSVWLASGGSPPTSASTKCRTW